MKVAIVHYWFITRRGGEKVVESILKKFPGADIYTLFYDRDKYGKILDNHKVFTSVFNNTFFRKHYQKIYPFYPLAIKSLKLKEDYDLIISSESGPAKGIKIKNNTPHICYIHSPMRYCWSHMDLYVNSSNPILRPFVKFFFKRLRNWDKGTINNVDLYIANSKNVANRVQKYYKKRSKIVYPPISNDLFSKPLIRDTKKEFYLCFGAITPYKRIDLLIDTFNSNGRKLVVIGEGAEKGKLIKSASRNIEFLGALSWLEIEKIIQKTKALIFPGEEDFGMIPLEVMAYGIPVIAFKKGGALETIVENSSKIKESTGIFFENQSINSIQKAIEKFESIQNLFNPNFIRNHSKKFSEEIFISNFMRCINDFLKQ